MTGNDPACENSPSGDNDERVVYAKSFVHFDDDLYHTVRNAVYNTCGKDEIIVIDTDSDSDNDEFVEIKSTSISITLEKNFKNKAWNDKIY